MEGFKARAQGVCAFSATFGPNVMGLLGRFSIPPAHKRTAQADFMLPLRSSYRANHRLPFMIADRLCGRTDQYEKPPTLGGTSVGILRSLLLQNPSVCIHCLLIYFASITNEAATINRLQIQPCLDVARLIVG